MSTESYLRIGATVVLLGLGWGWLEARDARIRAEGEARVYAAQRDSAVEVARADSVRADSLGTVADSALVELDRVREATDSTLRAKDRAITQIRADRDEKLAEARRHAGEDSVLVREVQEATAALYEPEIATLEEQVNVLHASMVQHEQTIYALTDERDALDAALQAERVVRRALESELVAVRAQSGGFFDSTPVKVATHVGAFALGWAAGG